MGLKANAKKLSVDHGGGGIFDQEQCSVVLEGIKKWALQR